MKMWTYRVIDGRDVGLNKTAYILTTPEGIDMGEPWADASAVRKFCHTKNKAMALV